MSGKGAYPDAIREYQAVLEVDPSHPDTLFHLSLVHAEQKEYEQGVDLCRRALIFDPDLPNGFYMLGRMYIKLGKQELEKAAATASNAKISDELDALTKLGY